MESNERELKRCIKGTYTINEDGSIDVDGDVNLCGLNLPKMMLKKSVK